VCEVGRPRGDERAERSCSAVSGTAISRTRSVIALANTPSLLPDTRSQRWPSARMWLMMGSARPTDALAYGPRPRATR
jgi:hypothetical protein